MDTLASLLEKIDRNKRPIGIYQKVEECNFISESNFIIESNGLYLDKNDFNTVCQYTKNIEFLRRIFIQHSSKIDFGFNLSNSFARIKRGLILVLIPINAKNLQKLAQVFLRHFPRNAGSYEAEPYQEAAVNPKFCKYIKAKVIHFNELLAKEGLPEYYNQIDNIYAMADEFLRHYHDGIISEEEVAIGTLVYEEVAKMDGGRKGEMFEFLKDFGEKTWEYRNKIMKVCIPPSHAELKKLIDIVQYYE
jgi:hypothetical protein